MSAMSLRSAMVPVSRRMRAYFAPFNQQTGSPAIFDPSKSGRFVLGAPPAPWLDLGWIDSFQRFSETSTEVMRAGATGGAVGQFHGPLSAWVEFDFREWGKLQMALACGSEQMNVLAAVADADAQPSGGTAVAAVAVLDGSSAAEIVCGAGAVDGFSVGDLVAVDVDYQQQTGFVGSGISAAYVSDPADVKHDANYIRRVTFNVGRVAEKTATSLMLEQPLPGGPPPAGAGIQKVMAFLDREGGSYFQDWSALFVAEEESGGRACFYYPRLSPNPGSASAFLREESTAIAKPLAALALRASFTAFPHVDENDGQAVLCYRSYLPAASAAVY